MSPSDLVALDLEDTGAQDRDDEAILEIEPAKRTVAAYEDGCSA